MRTLILLATLALAVPAAAQADADTVTATVDRDEEAWRPTARGVRTLGGSVGGVYSRFDSGRSVSLGASPAVGRFVADGLLLEMAVGANVFRSRFDSVDEANQPAEIRSRSVGGSVGPSLTRYFGTPDARLFPFIGATARVQGSWSRTSTDGSESGTGSRLDFFSETRAGVMVPVARNVGIEAQVVLPVFDTFGGGSFNRTHVFLMVGVSTFLY